MAIVRLIRRYRFCASHLYRRPEWDEAENRRQFGACANLPGHGHGYRLFVGVEGAPDPLTGFVIDLGALDRAVHGAVISRVDHRHLNEALSEFGAGGLVPSSENLVLWVRAALEPALPEGCRLVWLRLEEDEDLASEWLGS